MSQPSEIRELDPNTVERIAAGEVVERPASAVKELVENSLDADASRITVAVQSGGIDGIRVTDDGIGMSEDELRRAVKKHTTSKIQDIGDLEGGVGTLGFRGEALHAIGAVSRLDITTRTASSDHGTTLTLDGGEITDVSPAGCPEGTTVEVSDLFYNVPARRKYLKQASTEFDHVNTVVRNYALANPDVAVTLEHDGRETFATTGHGDLRETVLSVYGQTVAEAMRSLDDANLPDGPLEGVSGLVSHPETNRASRAYCSTFVNGRYVNASNVRDALVDAYGGQLASDRYPFAVLFIEVDPGTVDVNVHPRKMEIRFADESGVYEQVHGVVEDSLQRDGILRSSAPRGRSAPDQTTIEPGIEEKQSGTDTEGSGPGSISAEDEQPRTGACSTSSVDNEQSCERTGTAKTESSSTNSLKTDTGDLVQTRPDGRQERDQTGTVTGEADRPDTRRAQQRTDPSPKTQQTLEGEIATPATEYDRIPSLRVLGQLHDTYIVAEADDGLILVDQHAADERINYERLQDQFSGETTTQALAGPVDVELTAGEAELFETHEDALARLGFHAQRVDDRRIRVSTVPDVVADTAGPNLIQDILSDLVVGERTASATVEAIADDLIADMACHPSIKGNTSLTEGSVVELLSTLDSCDNPWACPHGRPVLIHLDTDEIEDRFERDYPGH